MNKATQQLALLAMKRLGVEQKELNIPPKKHTRLPGKMQNTFQENLRGVPGAGYKVGTYWWYQKMIEAEDTGCRVATAEQERRLEHSATNSNTTQGNYVTKL